jgi:hypothetical protein
LTSVGRTREPVPLTEPTATLREIFERQAGTTREWQTSADPLEADDIAYLDKILESHGALSPERARAADQSRTESGQSMEEVLASIRRIIAEGEKDASGVRLSSVLDRNLSDNVRNVLISAARAAEPSRTKGGTLHEIDLRAVARALIHYAIESEAKPIKAVILAKRLRTEAPPAAFRAEIMSPFEGTAIGGFDPNRFALSAGLNEAIELAADIARRTTKDDRISLRHLTAAVFLSEGVGQELLRSLWRQRLNTDVREFAPEFLRAIEASPSPTEDLAAWRVVLAPILRGQPTNRVRYHTAYGADLPDRTAKDSLDITADVEAFAELICLQSAKPPISIGLFGDWGSGKSFFMEKLGQRIEDLTAGGAGHEESPFVSNVVQIRFNAWTYADSENLWASLTAEFFDQLRAGGFAKAGDARYQELVNNVRSRVAMAADDLEALKGSASVIAERIRAAQSEIAALDQRLKTIVVDVARDKAGQILTAYIEGHKAELAASLRGLGFDVAEDKLADMLVNTSKIATRWRGKLRMIARAVWRRRTDKRVLMSFGFVGVVLLIVAILQFVDVSIFRPGWDWLLPFAAFVVPALRVGQTSWKLLRPLFAAGDKFMEDVDARRRDIGQQRQALQASLASLQSEAKKAGDEQAKSAAFIARYEAGAQGRSPAALLHFFLHGTEATREYDKHLGLVSRVRRSFEVLNALMLRPRAGGDATALPAIDRIVLYIDDLDRCRDAQVVQVLEAVHLLLAFPLFVVVVGVDARWLQHSLAKHYDEQLSAPERPEAEKASVTDYLEKIFQIPFWLRPLSVARDGKEGTYEHLVDDLTAKATAVSTPQAVPGPQIDPQAVTAIRHGATGAQVADPASVNTPLPLRATDAAVLETRAPVRSIVEVRKAVELEDAEIELMKAMGPVVGKSPRAVKRFVNLYRLIRARRAGEDLDDFLGKRGDAPSFPAVMFLLAIDTGLTAAEADAVFGAIRSYTDGPDADVSDSVAAALDIADRELPMSGSQQEILTRTYPATNNILAAVARALGGELQITHLLRVAPEVRRYSFRQRALTMGTTGP